MERIVEINGKKLVVGLEWSKLAGGTPLDAARKLSSARKSPQGLLWSVSVENGVIHSVGLSHKKFKGAVYSAAAALAKNQASVIAIERIDDDSYWLAVTEDGRVLPGYDMVTSEAEIKRMLQELAVDIQLDYMQFLMTSDVAASFGISESSNDSPFGLIGSIQLDDSMRIRNLMGIPKAAYLGVGIVLIGGALFGYTKYLEIQKQKELDELMAQEAMGIDESAITVEKTAEQNQAELLRAARQQEIDWLREDFNRFNTLPAMRQILVLASTLPSSKNGWVLDEIVLDSKSLDSFNVSWDRAGGSPSSLKAFIDNGARIGFTPTFDKASTAHPAELGSRGIEDILAVIHSNGTGHQDFASLLIQNGITFTSSVDEERTRREVIAGVLDQTLANMPQLEVKIRKFSMNGDSKESFVRLMSVMNNVDNFLPGKIVFSVQSNGISWSFEGKLYE